MRPEAVGEREACERLDLVYLRAQAVVCIRMSMCACARASTAACMTKGSTCMVVTRVQRPCWMMRVTCGKEASVMSRR